MTRNIKEICSFLRICGSPAFDRSKNAGKVCQSLLKGISYPEKALIFFYLTNLALKKASYDQWTLIQVTTITEEQLKEVRFYKKANDIMTVELAEYLV